MRLKGIGKGAMLMEAVGNRERMLDRGFGCRKGEYVVLIGGRVEGECEGRKRAVGVRLEAGGGVGVQNQGRGGETVGGSMAS